MLTSADGDHRIFQVLAWSGLGCHLALWAVLYGLTGISVAFSDIAGNVVPAAFALVFWGITLFGARHADALTERLQKLLPVLGQLAQWVILIELFPVANTIPCYLIATFGGALWDAELAGFDAMLGIDVAAIVQWSTAHPTLNFLFAMSYGSVFLQFPVVITVLTLGRNLRAAWEMAAIVLCGSFLGLFVFLMVPADGPFAYFDLGASPAQAGCLNYFHLLRDHAITRITEVHGIIAFPSYHVFFALVTTYAARRNRWLLAAFVILNLLNITATMTTGWHYFADVLGGLGLFLAITSGLHHVEASIARRKWFPPRGPRRGLT